MEPTIKQLRYLLSVSQARSFRGAADRLDVAQPTLTAQINALESKLGVTLLERSRKGAQLTPFGRSVMPHIETILEQVAMIQRLAAESEGSLVGTYRLGVPPTLGPYLLPEVIPAIHSAFPGLKVFVREDAPRDLEVGLLHGDYDFIITTLPMEIPNLGLEPLFNEPLLLVCANDHPFADQEAVTPDDLRGESLLAIEEKHRLFDLMQTIAAQYEARLLRDYEGTSLDTLRHMIGTGLGVAFLPSLYVRSEISQRQDVTSRHFTGAPFARGVVLAWRPGSRRVELYRQIANIMRTVSQHSFSDHITLDMQVREYDIGKL